MKQQEENTGHQLGRQNPPPAPAAAPIELPRVYADNSDKKRMIFHWAIFVGIMVLAMGLGTILPKALQNLPSNPECPNPTDLDVNNNFTVMCSGPFHPVTNPAAGVLATNVQPLNQFMILSIIIQLKEPASPQWNYNDTLSISFYSLKRTENLVKDFEFRRNATGPFIINIYYQNDTNRLYGLNKKILYMNAIESANFLFSVRFPTSNPSLQQVKNIRAYATVVNLSYSRFTLAIRYVFLILTTISSILYFLRLRKIDRSIWVLEQKMVLALSVITVFFNDPFYAVTITSPNHANNLFSVMWVVNLAVYLVLFWLTILDRINHENDLVVSNALTWKKAVYTVILWLSCFLYYLFYSYAYFMTSPLMTTDEFNKGGMVYLMMFVILLFVAGFGYMIAQYIQIFLKIETKLWRNQLFVFFSIFFIIVTFFFFFISGFDIHSFIGGRVIILYVQLNTYLFYMQYMYSPTLEAIVKHSQEPGPAFEMAAFDANTNIDELRSVEINFPDDHYNKLDEDHLEVDLGNPSKPSRQLKGEQNQFKDEDVIQLQ